jgi:hypothetical protein
VLRNCPQCGRLLATPPGIPCPACREEEDAAVARIEAYLAAGGVPVVAEVARHTGLRPGLLRRLVAAGRIALADGTAQAGACVLCGRPLASPAARLCEGCSRRLAPRGQAQGPAPPQPGPRLRRGLYSQLGPDEP